MDIIGSNRALNLTVLAGYTSWYFAYSDGNLIGQVEREQHMIPRMGLRGLQQVHDDMVLHPLRAYLIDTPGGSFVRFLLSDIQAIILLYQEIYPDDLGNDVP